MKYDLIIRNGKIVDGTGKPAYQGDLAILEGKIAELLVKQTDRKNDMKSPAPLCSHLYKQRLNLKPSRLFFSMRDL